MSPPTKHGRAPPGERDDPLPPELLEYMRQQHEDAKFRARLMAMCKRWTLAAVAAMLTATSGWEAVQKVLGWIRGPSP